MYELHYCDATIRRIQSTGSLCTHHALMYIIVYKVNASCILTFTRVLLVVPSVMI